MIMTVASPGASSPAQHCHIRNFIENIVTEQLAPYLNLRGPLRRTAGAIEALVSLRPDFLKGILACKSCASSSATSALLNGGTLAFNVSRHLELL